MDGIVRDSRYAQRLKQAYAYLVATKKYFPQYIEEIEGYAQGAGVDFVEFWAQGLEDGGNYYYHGHCSSMVTNGGKLIAHNEDWASDAADQICIVQKTVGDLTILELNYFVTLGGNSASINSHGYVQLINTLSHTDWQIGVPRNVIARFMSETSDPIRDFEKLKAIKRASGYNHNIVGLDGRMWNIESTAERQLIISPPPPFVHTNHYLLQTLKPFQAETSQSTFRRYDVATKMLRSHMSLDGLMYLTADNSQGPDLSIFNERTIARMVVDLERKVALIWLARESDKGWVEYPLTFVRQA